MNTSLVVPFAAIDQMRKLAEILYPRGEINHAYALASAIADVVQATGTPGFYAATPFGVCPFCGDYEQVVYVVGKQYAACHEHRVYWYIGADFVALHNDKDEMLQQNSDLFRTHTQIPATEAFPATVCSCCGLSRSHAAWCILSSTLLDDPLAQETDLYTFQQCD